MAPFRGCILGVMFTFALAFEASGQSPTPTPVITSPQIPADVSIPDGFKGNPIAFFDDYSWRAFVALVWPALNGHRGVPDPSQKVGVISVPLVFETFKADWEVFQPNGTRPSPWESYEGVTPCPNLQNVAFGDVVLASFSKFGNIGQAGFGNLVGPLVAQNGTYLRYLTGFNQKKFARILKERLYLRKNLGKPVHPLTIDVNSLDVKSAWMDMTNVKNCDRYYTRTAYVFDVTTSPPACSKKTVGLVGLHIVQKTQTRPQWIWSTFEQVDNVPPGNGPFALNNGIGTPMPLSNPIKFPPPPTPPPPFNVERKMPIHQSTQNTNTAYQNALKGTVWQFYELVLTQWPVPANTPANRGTPGFTFPGTNATTSFANTSMETFDQTKISTGCMNCHNITKAASDFDWTISINAFPTPTP